MNIVAGARNRRVRAALRVERRDRVQAQIVHFWRLICGASELQAVAAGVPAKSGRRSGLCTLKTYPGFPHGMLTTHADVLNPDLLAFIQS